jgi:CheY-like chemotaxis protein
VIYDLEEAMATILVVDDEQYVHDGFEVLFEGHTVLSAFTGAEARARFNKRQKTIDVVLMDGYLAMDDPEKTTLKLAQYMRNCGFTKPIIAISGDDKMRKSLLTAGCSHEMVKANTARLKKLVESLI